MKYSIKAVVMGVAMLPVFGLSLRAADAGSPTTGAGGTGTGGTGTSAPSTPGTNANPSGMIDQNQNPNVPSPMAPNPNGTNPNTLNPNTPNPPNNTDLGAPNASPSSINSNTMGNSAAPADGTDQRNQVQSGRNGGRTGSVNDRQLFRGIREAVGQAPSATQTGTSSATGVQDLKIFRKNGKVILSGTVHSQEEKDSVGARASAAAGEQQVVNQLRVK